LDAVKWDDDWANKTVAGSVFSTTDGENSIGMFTDTSISVSDVALRWKLKYSGADGDPGIGMKFHHVDTNLADSWWLTDGYVAAVSHDTTSRTWNYQIYLRYAGGNEGLIDSKPVDLPRDVWNVFELRKYGTSISLLKDGVEKLSSTTTNTLSGGKIVAGTWTLDGDTHEWDWIILRKYTSPEPTVGLAGIEEKMPSRGGGVSPSGGGAMMF
jgi:hypothetical protein